MVTYVFNKKHCETLSIPECLNDFIFELLVQTDFNEEDVCIRIAEFKLFVLAISLFKSLATKNSYHYHQIRENEFDVFQDKTNLKQGKTRYIFMNSIPDNYDENTDFTN